MNLNLLVKSFNSIRIITFKFLKLQTESVYCLNKEKLSASSYLYGQSNLIKTKVFKIEPFCYEQKGVVLQANMAILENQVTKVEEVLNSLENCYTNAKVTNKDIKLSEANKNYFAHFFMIAQKIKQAAKLIEENAGAIALEQPKIIDVSERIKVILENAKKIKLIFIQQKFNGLKSIDEVVDSLCYLINVIEDTLEINSINDFVEESRKMKVTDEEDKFLKDIFSHINEIPNYKN